MKKTSFFLLILLSLKGFTQNMTHNEERSLGVIYSSNTWASLTGFTQNGGTWTTSGGKILCSTGTGTYTQSLDYTAYGVSKLPKWHMYLRSSVASITSTSYGIGIGIRSYNQYSGGTTDAIARLSMFTGDVGQAYLTLGTTHASTNTSATNIAISANDLVEQTVDMDGFFITTTIRNVTQNGAPITISYLFQTVTGGDPLMPNTGTFSIFALGGSLKVDSFAISSNTPVNSSLAIGGDSKVQGYEVSTEGYTICSQVAKYIKSCVNLGGGFDRTAELSARVPEIIKLHPKVFLNLIGSNDVRSGVSAAVYEARYDSINNALKAAGIRVLVGVLYESSVNMLPLQQYIIANYPAANFIDFYDLMNISGTLASGNVHPNNYGDSVASSAIIQFFGFYNQTPRYTPDLNGAYNWTSPHSWQVQPGNIAINNISFGSTTPNAVFGTYGIQSVALNNGFLQENLTFNGSTSTYLNTGFGEGIQFFNGDINFFAAASGSGTATLHNWMIIKNNGIGLFGGSSSNGAGNFQVTGSGGITIGPDNSHFADYSSNSSGDAFIGSVSKFYGLGITPTAELNFGTTLSHAEWGMSGIKFVSASGNLFTNTSTANGGTVTSVAFNLFAADTINTTNTGITYTNAYELYIPSGPQHPVNNTQGVSITNPFSLGLGGNIYVSGPNFNILNGGTGNVQQNSAGTFSWSSFVNTNAHWQFGYVTPPLSGGVYNHGTIDIDSLMNFNVPGNISIVNAGHGLNIAEGSNSKVGQTTLSSGAKSITITGLTSSSRAFVQLVTPSGVSLTVNYQAVCSSNTLVIQANIAAGTINTNDGSTLNYFVIN